MQYALVDGEVLEPTPGLKGICRNCEAPMIAKCGQHKLWHWAHKSRMHCDPWWEPETDWHRAWKNYFPKEWHEVILFDSILNEKHIADVRTDKGLVLEFQHSTITPEETKAREQFYGNMVWVVDGCRGALDAAHFNLSLGTQINESPVAYAFRWWGHSKLFDNWILATKPVFIDFGEANLWRLILFDPLTKRGAVGPAGRKHLVDDFIKGSPLARVIPSRANFGMSASVERGEKGRDKIGDNRQGDLF
jgi:competence protein CoiA